MPFPRLLCAALGALAFLPATGSADATAPEPPLAAVPVLSFQAPDRVQLTFRTRDALATRFDGEVLGRARISARTASLYPVGAATAHCYAGRITPGPMRVGRRYTVRLLLDGAAPVERTLVLRRARPGDARGRRLGC